MNGICGKCLCGIRSTWIIEKSFTETKINKTLQYPINIKCPNPRLAKFIISQYGGPDGELAASLRYLSQRFGMPDQKSKAILNDIRN